VPALVVMVTAEQVLPRAAQVVPAHNVMVGGAAIPLVASA